MATTDKYAEKAADNSGKGRIFWNNDADDEHPWIPHYSGRATIGGREYRIEGWREGEIGNKSVRVRFITTEK